VTDFVCVCVTMLDYKRIRTGALRRWKTERGRLSASATFPRVSGMPPSHTTPHFSTICERVVVLNKRDLVPEWGLEVVETMSSRPTQHDR
jgi:hypothetical protein